MGARESSSTTASRTCYPILAALGFVFAFPVSTAALDAEQGAEQGAKQEQQQLAKQERPQLVKKEQPQLAEVPDVAAAPPDLPVYRPPARGKPHSRVPSAVRSPGRGWPALTALVPEHTGRTTSESPSLFWYVDEALPSDTLVVFTLTEEEHMDPLVEVALAPPAAAGIQHIDLGQLGVGLRSGLEYRWSVALVVDANQRTRDVVAVGYVERVEIPPELTSLSDPSVGDLANHGLWYDALAAAEDQIRSDPADLEPRRARDGLLRQAGLEAAVPVPGN